MLNPGRFIGDTLEAGSMARAIEDQMLLQQLFQADDETAEAAENRRKAVLAIATGVVSHLKANLEIVIAQHRLDAATPPAQVTLRGSAGEVL